MFNCIYICSILLLKLFLLQVYYHSSRFSFYGFIFLANLGISVVM